MKEEEILQFEPNCDQMMPFGLQLMKVMERSPSGKSAFSGDILLTSCNLIEHGACLRECGEGKTG